MAETKDLRLSDDTIVYIRDILTLGLITQTDVVAHLRQIRLDTETRGEVQYLVPSDEYKEAYAIISNQLVAAMEQLESDEVTAEG